MQTQIYAVDGYFYTQRVSGIQRYSLEILAELDKIIPPGKVEVVVPTGTKTPPYQNLRVVEHGKAGALWEQCAYPLYLAKHHRTALCTCNVMPLFGARGGVAVLHDVCYRARPDFYSDLRGRLSAAWHCWQYRHIAACAGKIVTVSEFSKGEIIHYYGVAPGKISVIPNAWQHMQRVQADESVFDAAAPRWPGLKPGGYYFSMANLLKNKNFPWVLRAAQRNPNAVFAIAGSGSLQAQAESMGLAGLKNVFYLGYVSDGEAKTLMANCKAFLFPTLYEGFGIPPLEAAACGAPRVIVSDTPCMREIYGDCADYIDLATNQGDLAAIAPGQGAAGALARYSWAGSAQKLAALLGITQKENNQ